MGHVGDRIFELARVQRTTGPVGKAGPLVQRDPQPAVDQIGIADLFALPDGHGGNLGVEDGMGRLAGQIVDDFHILSARMENLEHILVIDQQLQQGAKINTLGQRVDRGRFLAIGNLDEAEDRPIGILAHELGIDGDKIRGRETRADIGDVLIVRQQFMDKHFYPIQRAAQPANNSSRRDEIGGKPWHFGHSIGSGC